MFEIIRNYIPNPEGRGDYKMMLLELVVVVEVCITMDQLHDKMLCTSLQMTLKLRFCSNLLEPWTAAMHHFVVLLNADILFHCLSLLFIFSLLFLRNNLRQVIPSCPKTKTANFTKYFIVQVSWIDFSTQTHTHILNDDGNDCFSQSTHYVH